MHLTTAPDFLGSLSRGVSIRRATSADVPDLIDIESIFPTDRLTEADFIASLGKANDTIFVASQVATILGYALCQRRKRPRSMRLFSIATNPDFQGCGIGAMLLKNVEFIAINEGFDRVHLEVRADNWHAMNFYSDRGYKKFGIYRRYYEDGGHALRMCKQVQRGANGVTGVV